MASDNDQETGHKISQENRKTSLLLQTNTRSHKREHPNISGIKWKLRIRNRCPKWKPTKLWIRILGHQWNQKIITLPRRQRKDSRHNPKRVALPPITNRGRNTKIWPRSYACKGKPQIIKVVPERRSSGRSDRQKSRTWLGISPKNWIITSHQERGSRLAWGIRTIINRQ